METWTGNATSDVKSLSSLLARETNWMETAYPPRAEYWLVVPYSLGKPIEWKHPNDWLRAIAVCSSLLARETNWMETSAVSFSNPIIVSGVPYSLGKPIEWKLLIRAALITAAIHNSLLARETNWMETPISYLGQWPTVRIPYSLGKPIEWKPFFCMIEALAHVASLLARETNWMETCRRNLTTSIDWSG